MLKFFLIGPSWSCTLNIVKNLSRPSSIFYNATFVNLITVWLKFKVVDVTSRTAMDVTKLDIFYSCFYCKKNFYSEKENLRQHWKAGQCKRMRECYSAHLIVQSSSYLSFVNAFLNPKNIDVDIYNVILKNLRWPTRHFHFTTRDNWKTAKQQEYLRESSEEEK